MPRRPWLDAEQLKEVFHRQSAAVHPDRVHEADETGRRQASDAYSALNAAHQCLRELKDCLHHLVQLERGRKPGDMQSIPDDLMRLFREVGTLLRQTETVLAQRQQASSALLKVQAMQQALPQLAQLDALQANLGENRTRLLDELRALDAAWMTKDGMPRDTLLDQAENLYHQFGFLDRWTAHMRERLIQLTL
jgi:DnaJ-domain-containing protein 1